MSKHNNSRGLMDGEVEPSMDPKPSNTGQEPLLAVDETEMDLDVCPHMGQEVEEGNVEHKLHLVAPTCSRKQHLATQLHWRLNEGDDGVAIYLIGVSDDGTPVGLCEADLKASLQTLKEMAAVVLAQLERVELMRAGEGRPGRVARVHLRRITPPGEADTPHDSDAAKGLRVAVIGHVDAGKSTLIGVLTRGCVDNGRGLARMQVFRHSHEVFNGLTSSISQQAVLLHLGSTGRVRSLSNADAMQTCTLDPSQGAQASIDSPNTRLLTFIDQPGHEKYLKTTLYGLTGHSLDYVMLVIGATEGMQRMTREHLAISLALGVPLFVVITKVDVAARTLVDEILESLTAILQAPPLQRQLVVANTSSDAGDRPHPLEFPQDPSAVPVFCVSNVTGVGLESLKTFLGGLYTPKPLVAQWAARRVQSTEVRVDDVFQVEEVGTVFSGTVHSGVVRVGDALLVGPNRDGRFDPCVVISIHVRRLGVLSAVAGQHACFAMETTDGKIMQGRHLGRKGMVLLAPPSIADTASQPLGVYEFEAEIMILQHPSAIRMSYEAVVHAHNIRQSARIVSISDTKSDDAATSSTDAGTPNNTDTATGSIASTSQTEDIGVEDAGGGKVAGDKGTNLRKRGIKTGEKALCTFRFLHHPEYLRPGTTIVFREGRTKGFGKVCRVGTLMVN